MRAALLLLLLGACTPAGGTTWHVDFAAGDDSRDGRTPATAWKRAPGDPEAGGRAATARLQPGDTVQFRGGIAYRGTIRLPASGAEGKPIVYSGSGWGDGAATIDGADPVLVARPCRDAADCGGAAGWAGLHRIEFNPPSTARLVLFGAGEPYTPSQLPALPEPFFGSDRRHFAAVPAAGFPAGEIVSRELAALAQAGGGAMEVALWVHPNIVERRPLIRTEGDSLFFDPQGLRFRRGDEGRVSLIGSFAGLDKPGRFASLSPGVIVARLHPGDSAATLAIGSGRLGIDLNRQAHVTIRAFRFANFAGSAGEGREGRAITATADGARAIAIEDNRFGPAFLEHGSGFVHIRGVAGLRFTGNRMTNVFGAGFRAVGGRPSDLLVAGNHFGFIGRTAIGVLGVDRVTIRGNTLADIRGVHGNAITAYLSNRGVTVAGNCVWNSSRPMTFHGEGSNREPEADEADEPGDGEDRPQRRQIPGRHDIRVTGNIFLSSETGQAAINSWGRETQGVTITDNLLAGPKMGLLLNRTDRDVTVSGNWTTGIARADRGGPDWTIKDNRTDLRWQDLAAKATTTPDSCTVPGTPFATRRSAG